jgi:hypothetical protein
MQRETLRLLKVSALTALLATVSAHAELVRNPTQVGGNFDVGQIVGGVLYQGSSYASRAKNQVITRTGVYLTESGVYNDRLTIQITVGGLFWFALPETESFQTRRIQFGPGVGQAQGVYAFGADPAKPSATLQFGLFPYKYSDAVNLGEYLYRSGTYPGTLVSGGWSYINSAAYMAQGARVSVPMLDGALNHDITLFMERDLEPANDLSPGYLVTYRPTGFLEVGAGVVWAHALSLNSDRLSRHDDANKYSVSTGRPTAGDTAAVNPCRDGVVSDCDYWTFKGFKTMARASVDLGLLIGNPMIHAGDFKLYAEAALLGIEDQPWYYEKKSERMPVMVGVNLPTMGLFDRLSLEGEYQKTAFPNNNSSVLSKQIPIPVADGDAFNFDPDDAKTQWKWTVYFRRQLINGVSLYGQAASDHLRHFDFTATPGAVPTTQEPDDWYYVLRLEFGI